MSDVASHKASYATPRTHKPRRADDHPSSAPAMARSRPSHLPRMTPTPTAEVDTSVSRSDATFITAWAKDIPDYDHTPSVGKRNREQFGEPPALRTSARIRERQSQPRVSPSTAVAIKSESSSASRSMLGRGGRSSRLPSHRGLSSPIKKARLNAAVPHRGKPRRAEASKPTAND